MIRLGTLGGTSTCFPPHTRAHTWRDRDQTAPKCPSPRPPPCAEDLHALASAVGRLSPSHRDPERFHLDRSEIVGQLRKLARLLERAS